MKFYNKSWFMFVSLVLFAPIGLWAMWKNHRFNKVARIIVTVVALMWFSVASIGMNGGSSTTPTVATKKVTVLSTEQIATNKAKVVADQKIADAKEVAYRKQMAAQDVIDQANYKKEAAAQAIIDKQAAKQAIIDKQIADKAAAFEQAKAAKAAKAEAYKTWVADQFSTWDGSETYLVDLVKSKLNDDKSFEHVKTTYVDKGTYLVVFMEYRAKNAFGGLILQNVTAKADYASNTIQIISAND